MTNYQFSFEKLEVWQLSKKLTIDIYRLTKSFPPDEKYALISQIRRSASSVCANLAEGTTREKSKDQARFTTIAFGSLMELLNHLIISKELEYFNQNQLDEFKQRIQILSIKISNLKASQLRKSA